MELPGAASLATFCAGVESELEFTDELKDILEVIALTGNYWHDWPMLKCLLSFRLKQVLTQYYDSHIASGGQQTLVYGEPFNDFQRRLLEGLDSFVDGPPFTLQRLCELLLNPGLTYPNIDKVALAFEKLLLVTSTIPVCKEPYPSFTNSKEQQGCNQMQEIGQGVIATGENGAVESRTIADEEMPDVALNEDKQLDAEKLPSEEASLSLENKLVALAPEENHSPMPDFEKVHGLSESPLMDDDLVDISLDDQKSVTEA